MNKPPRFADKLLEWYCNPDLLEDLQGDLHERFQHRVKRRGLFVAKLLFTIEVIAFIRPYTLRRRRKNTSSWSITLLSSYILVAMRNMRKQPLFAWINVLSLSLALASSLAIFLFVHQQVSYDRFHTRFNNIYRLLYRQTTEHGVSQLVALNGSPFGPDMHKEFPEISNYTRYWNDGSGVYTAGEQTHLIQRVALVDSTFFDVLDFRLVMGDRATALDEPNSILMTAGTALKFFPSLNAAMGQTIRERASNPENEHLYTITGIIEDPPLNSHLQFNILESISTYARENKNFNDWSGNFMNTYFLLSPSSNPKQIEAKFPEWLIRWTGVKDVNQGHAFMLQPLSGVHLDSQDVEHDYSNISKFSRTYVQLFAVLAIFILAIGAANFVNITLARASGRWKEIGVRRSLGAFRRLLIRQFMFETMLVVVIASTLAVGIDVLLIPILNDRLGLSLSFEPFFTQPTLVIVVAGAIVMLGVLVSLYPAFVLSSQRLTDVLKGTGSATQKSLVQPTLIVIQYAVSLMLIIGAFTVSKQLSFMRERDPGFQREQMLTVHMNSQANWKFAAMKQELLTSSWVAGVTASSQGLGRNIHQTSFTFQAPDGKKIDTYTSGLNVERDFFKVYGISFAQGEGFGESDETGKTTSVVINESMVRDLSVTSPLGMPATRDEDFRGTVVGVTKDFNFNSLHHKVEPLAIFCKPDWGFDEMTIKLDGRHIAEGIALAEAVWKKHVTYYPFTYTFLDDHFESLYKADAQLATVMNIMTWLALALACLGLFGLAAIVTSRRVKEIGIRKVLGASFSEIITLLYRQFALLIVIAFVAATPVTYAVVTYWLDGFAYKVEVSPMLFAGAGLLLFVAAMLAIALHTVRSARTNPVESLRSQ